MRRPRLALAVVLLAACGTWLGLGSAALDGGRAQSMVLALSWQPAFCEGAPGRPECRALRPGDRAARAFSLHGLWPGDRGVTYCGAATALKDRRWSDLPEPGIDRETAAALARAMPGMRSGLHRHQWAKHGSCAGTDADRYFATALALTAEANGSILAEAFRRRTGARLTAGEIRAVVAQAFGEAAAGRISILCRDGMIVELRLHLRGQIDPAARLAPLMAAARSVPPGCRGGRVDPV